MLKSFDIYTQYASEGLITIALRFCHYGQQKMRNIGCGSRHLLIVDVALVTLMQPL